jgi:hypothetical protein
VKEVSIFCPTAGFAKLLVSSKIKQTLETGTVSIQSLAKSSSPSLL